jgi:hypothetical protein
MGSSRRDYNLGLIARGKRGQEIFPTSLKSRLAPIDFSALDTTFATAIFFGWSLRCCRLRSEMAEGQLAHHLLADAL